MDAGQREIIGPSRHEASGGGRETGDRGVSYILTDLTSSLTCSTLVLNIRCSDGVQLDFDDPLDALGAQDAGDTDEITADPVFLVAIRRAGQDALFCP